MAVIQPREDDLDADPSIEEAEVAEGEPSRTTLYLTAGIFAALALICLIGFSIVLLSFEFQNAEGLVSGAYSTAAPILLALTFVFMLLVIAVLLAHLADTITHNVAQLLAHQERSTTYLSNLNERVLLSDSAKRIAFREKDRQALREAIREDIEKGDFDAAMVLVSEMSRTYGYRVEAEQFRDEIEAARSAEIDQRIAEAIRALDKLLAAGKPVEAEKEADKIRRLYPDAPQVRDLDAHMDNAKQEIKRGIERRFMEAYNHEDWEAAYAVIPEMDRHFSAGEAERFTDPVKEVVAKRRDNMRIQLRIAMEDKEWHSARLAAEQIIKEFPSTRMAEEAKTILGELRKRDQENAG